MCACDMIVYIYIGDWYWIRQDYCGYSQWYLANYAYLMMLWNTQEFYYYANS